MAEQTTKKHLTHGQALILAAILLAAAVAVPWLAGPRRGLEAAHVRALAQARLAATMRADLDAVAKAEKSAVLADTDEDSLRFAEASRAAVERVAAGLDRLGETDDAGEADLVRGFATAFAEYRKANEEVLGLAVQNTNLKALALSFGQASAALADMAQALAPLGDNPAALRARIAALRVQALHAPHIMEKTEARMDALERDMARADRAARAALAALPAGEAAVRAREAYALHWRLTGDILRLSRQNTNVRSLELSLGRTTRLLAACAEALGRLETLYRERLDTRATR